MFGIAIHRSLATLRHVTLAVAAGAIGLLIASGPTASAAEKLKTVSLDWATYNPVSLVLKEKGWVEEEFKKDGITVQWVQSISSSKALEYLNAKSIQFGSTAGAAALLARINGNPIRSVYVYSKPEWTALVVAKNSTIQKVEDLKGKRVAAMQGTDPYIFLVRALAAHGMSEKDIQRVLVSHPDGRIALERGDVDAWAGLDPMMAQTELEAGSRLFFRNPDANTYGVLNVQEDFAKEHPDIVARVLAVYERGRKWSLANQGELKRILAAAAKLTEPVAARQLERTNLTNPILGKAQRDSIQAAGIVLQQAGIIDAKVNVEQAVTALIEPKFGAVVAKNLKAR